MKLMDFYKSILEDIDIFVDDDGYLAFQKGENKLFVTRRKGKKVILPTKENLENFFIDVDGEIIPKGLLFNPLKESIGRDDNIGTDIYRDGIEVKIGLMLAALGNNMILSLSNPETQSDLGLELNQCFANLRKYVPGMKKPNSVIGDETMIKNWNRFINALSTDPEDPLLRILTSDDRSKKYAKIGKLIIDTYTTLGTENEEGVKVHNIKLRPKDLVVFKSIIDLLIPDINKEGVSSENTEVKEAPVFTTLLNMFYKIANRYKDLMDALKHVDTETANSCVIKNNFSKEFINEAYKKYSFELSSLPVEKEINGSKKMLSVVNNVNGTKDLNIVNETNKLVDYSAVKTTGNPLRNMLRAKHPELNFMGNIVTNYTNPVQQPMMQPQVQVPYTTNMFQQPQMFQNMQPMNQPMVQNMYQGFPQQVNPFQQQNNMMANAARPKNEAPDTLEIKSNKKMVSVLDPSLNVQQPMVNVYSGMYPNQMVPNQNIYQMPQPVMYGQPGMMPVQGVYQPMVQQGWR